MNPIYLRQVAVDNPETRAAIDAAKGGDHDLLLDLFDLNFGPWNRFDENKPFWGDRAWPEGAGFYPADMTRDDYDQWLAKHPQDKAAFARSDEHTSERQSLLRLSYAVFCLHNKTTQQTN